MKCTLRLLLALSLVGLIFFRMAVLPLKDGYQAVITHFGKPTRVVSEAGPHLHWPWPIDKVYEFDCRKRVYNTKFTQTLTKDKKSLILLTYIVWQVKDPLLFLQALGDDKNAQSKIEGLVSSSKNNILGDYYLSNLVSDDISQLKTDEIEAKILASVQKPAMEKLGIEISELAFKRIAYPENNIDAIFNQMRAERGKYAAEYRAEGRKRASIIMSNTDVEIAKINAESIKKAAEIKGDADRQAAEIYAKAHKDGAEFYKFSRSLEALEQIVNKNAVFILRSDKPPFDKLYDE